jgi:hypothetical protein
MAFTVADQRDAQSGDVAQVICNQVLAARLHEQVLGVAVFEHMQHFGPGVLGVQTHAWRAYLHAGEEMFIDFDGLQREDGDGVVLAVAELLQGHGKAVGAFVHLAPRGAAVAAQIGGLGRIVLRTAPNHVAG